MNIIESPTSAPPPDPVRRQDTPEARRARQRGGETAVTWTIRLAGMSSILFVLMILYFLLSEGLPALGETPMRDLLSSRWYPPEALYGILPLLSGTLIVTLGAALVAVPLGVAAAVFIAEVAPRRANDILKPIVEILAGIPSVVLGFIGILLLSPFLRRLLDLPTGLTGFTGSLLLGAIAIPTVVSIAEDAFNNVPTSYRQAALALGATRWQTIWGVTFPAARSGILTAIMLGIGRAMGETMAVMMVTGNAPVLPHGLDALFLPVRTMTATIASEMGEVATGSQHYHVLFLVGIVLFVLSLIINIIASRLSLRGRSRAERVLS